MREFLVVPLMLIFLFLSAILLGQLAFPMNRTDGTSKAEPISREHSIILNAEICFLFCLWNQNIVCCVADCVVKQHVPKEKSTRYMCLLSRQQAISGGCTWSHFSVCNVFTASSICAGSEQLKSFPLTFKQCFSHMCKELLQMLPFLTLT